MSTTRKSLFRRHPSILILDALFLGSAIGLIATPIAVSLSLVRAVSGEPTRYLLTGVPFWVFVASLGVAIFLAGAMALDVYRRQPQDEWHFWLWKRVLAANTILTGPTAYYLSSFRPRVLQRPQHPSLERLRQSRLLLDCLSGATLGSATAMGLSFAMLLVLRASHLTFVIATSTLVVGIAIGGISLAVFLTLMLIDVAHRPAEQLDEVGFLRLLNPWAWVFGLRTYYFRVVRPEFERTP